MILTLVIKKDRYQVHDLADAAEVYSTLRDHSGLGASKWPEGFIIEKQTAADPGEMIARISYNGRVWSMADDTLLFA